MKKMDFDFGVGSGFGTEVGFVEDLAGDDSGAGSGFGTEVDFVEEKFFDGTGALEGSGRTEVGFVEDVVDDERGTLEGSGAGEETDEFFQEEIFFAQRQAADADDFVDEDFVTFEAVKSFGIKYLFPWQRIVIQNILDAAGVCGDEEDGLENDELLEGGFCNDRDGFTEGAFCNEIDDLETDTAFVNGAAQSSKDGAFRNEESVLETGVGFVNRGGASLTEETFRNEIDVLETDTAFVNGAGASSTDDTFRNDGAILETDTAFVNGAGASLTDGAFRNDGAILETDTAFVNSAGASLTESAFRNDGAILETEAAFVNSAGASSTDGAFRNEIDVLETRAAFVNSAGASSTESAFRNDGAILETDTAFVNSAAQSSKDDAFRNEESDFETDTAFVNSAGASSTESAFRNEIDVLETEAAFVNSAGASSTGDAFRNEESVLETGVCFVNSAAPSSTDDAFRNEDAAFETSSSFVKSALPDEASNSKTAPSFFDLPPSSSARQIVLLPTGAGKSLCFLTPALLLPGPTMVLYPLLALMSDQKRRMDEGKMKSVVFRGGQTEEEREENFLAIKEGAKIILANPEVLQNENLVKRLSKCNICHIAIDEAHCVWEWGSTFRPAYLTLGKIIKALNVKVVTAFTATASPLVLEKISQVLFDGNAHIVRSDGDRPNIHYNVINTYAKKKEVFRLAVTEKKPLIVFCGTRKKSEDMARQLSQFYGSDKVKFYHAGMEREEKDAVEKWFYPKEDAILCCTCAFGMGVDKKDIRTVIHLEASPTAEAYIQEAGRGGRDGSVANAILLWSPSDREKFLKFPEDSRERVLMNYAESKTCRREVLLNALGDQLTYCDGCDVCQRGGPAPFAKDGEYLLKFLSKHKKLFKRERLETEIQNAFNEKDLPFFKKNIWEDSDIREMINQLERENKIYACKWPWRKLYSVRKIK